MKKVYISPETCCVRIEDRSLLQTVSIAASKYSTTNEAFSRCSSVRDSWAEEDEEGY